MSDQTRIVIADDHPIFRRGLREVIEGDQELLVVAEAEDGVDALAQIEAHHPDLAVLDLDMPKLDGFGVVRALREQRLSVACVVLTMHKGEDLFNEAMDQGVLGYVLKDSVMTDILGGIRAARAGQPFVSPLLTNYLLNRRTRAAALAAARPGLQTLTPTERRVLGLIAEDKTTRQIAGEL